MNPAGGQPLYFGREAAPLFGWLHRRPPHSQASFGLVICNPFGFEEVCAHRSLRQLAQACADGGIPVLRFDYAGCGNSAGDEHAPATLTRWVDSVHDAVDALRQATGLPRVCLLGLRLGALLATMAAAERDDVAGLLAVAPVLRGRAYLRELTLLAQAGAAPAEASGGADASDDGRVESAGFVIEGDTARALAAVDLTRLTSAPAPRVLLVERDDMPGPKDWAPSLERLGAEVTRADGAGYAAMMDDPQRSVVPVAIIDGVVRQLEAWAARDTAQRVMDRPVGADSMTTAVGPETSGSIVERAVRIDTGGSTMVGILTVPLGAPAEAASPVVVMLNAGAVHLIGPNRLWVRLARRWAARGQRVLRIDLPGIGGSDARPDQAEGLVYAPHAVADVTGVLRWTKARFPAAPCHLVGLCSGAYHALKAVVAGPAVASAVLVNPLTYCWHEGDELSEVHDYEVAELASRYRGKALTREPWARLLRGELDLRLILQVLRRRIVHVAQPWLLEAARRVRWPLRHDLAIDLHRAARAGVHLRFVFGDRAAGHVLLQRQAGRCLPDLLRRRHVSIDVIADSDHTFTRSAARERLVRLLDGWPAPDRGAPVARPE